MTPCSLCPRVNPCIPPSGPIYSKFLLLGEAPGKDESRVGAPFVGKTGEELNNHYIPLSGLRRSNVRVTNSICCLPVTTGGKLDPNREKDRDLLNCCSSHHLHPEISSTPHKILVPMGRFACMALDPDIDLEFQHGIPIRTSWGVTFPMFHPSLGIHEPKKILMIRNDWIRLGLHLRGQLRIPVDEYPNPDYRMADARQVREDLADMIDFPIACDTESRRNREPHCLTYSVKPGTGRMIMAGDAGALAEFQYWIDRWQAEILWHNWLYDIQVTMNMGLRFPRRRIVDTMVRVFHLGNLPQGLKALAFRELGMKMQDYEDVVTPHSSTHVLNYYKLAAMHTWPKPEEELIRGADGKFKLYKAQSFNTLLKRFFTDLGKDPTKDLYKSWDNWESKHSMIEEAMGPFPGKCISHTPPEEAMFYACRDADALLRLWPRVKRMVSQMRQGPQEKWAEWKVAA